MSISGNKRLYDHLAKYDLVSADAKRKFQSRAALHYRRRLAALVADDREALAELDAQGEPSFEEGRLPIEY